MEFSRIIKIILNAILVILLVNLIFYAGYLAYISWPRASETMHSDYNSKIDLVKLSANITQFSPNMRFNHNNLSYFILECDGEKISRLKEAFSIIENETKIIKFYQTNDEDNADIHVGCSKNAFETEKNVFVAGEGGPTKFLNLSLYPAILQGKIILYEESSCDYPITELHEIFHVFGFEHVNDSLKIMYPYVNCRQRIDPELINMLIELYSIEPLAELYFKNVSVVKTGIYLNFSVQINNEGLVNAKNVSLEVYDENKKIDSFDLKEIKFGSGETFWVGNLMLNSINTQKIILKIVSNSREYNNGNNVIELKI